MRRRRSVGSVLSVLCGLLLCLLLQAPSVALTYRDRVTEHTLPNGFKLILLPDPKAPVAVFQVWYRVGSRHEVPGRTGLSHLLEHMMFKGTPTIGPEQYSRIVQRNGGTTNAFTTRDHTTYFATLASDRLALVAELEADRMVNLTLDPDLFAPERDVVAEERRLRTDNDPVAALFEQLWAAAYTAHPYQAPIIGWMSDIAGSRVTDLRTHYEAHYLPNNAFAVVVGDVLPRDAIEIVTTRFGSVPAKPPPDPIRSVEPRQQGERRVTVRRPAELPFVALAYHVPTFYSPDAAALEVLSEVLAGGRSSRLQRELGYRRRLARSTGAYFDYASPDPGLFVLYGQPFPGRTIEDVEAALLAELDRLQRQPPSEREMQKAKNRIEAAFLFAQDSIFYQGMLLGKHEVAGDWRDLDAYLPAIRAVGPEDLLRVTRFYFGQDNRTVATLVPHRDGVPVPPAAATISGVLE